MLRMYELMSYHNLMEMIKINKYNYSMTQSK